MVSQQRVNSETIPGKRKLEHFWGRVASTTVTKAMVRNDHICRQSRRTKPDSNKMPGSFTEKNVSALESSFLLVCKLIVTENHKCFTTGDCKAGKWKDKSSAAPLGTASGASPRADRA